MSRATAVYILMLAACAVGMWVIARAGARLRATPGLAGHWEITANDAPTTGPAVAAAAAAPAGPIGTGMVIEQSGRYVHVRFAGGLALALKAEPAAPPGADGAKKVYMADADGRKLVARIEAGDRDTAFFLLTGPADRAAFSARRRTGGAGGAGHAHAGAAVPSTSPPTVPEDATAAALPAGSHAP